MKPFVSYFKTFGCIGFVHVPDKKRSKLDDKSVKCVLLGVSEEFKAYRLYDPLNKKIYVSRDVKFQEDAAWEWDEAETNEAKTNKMIDASDHSEEICPAAEEVSRQMPRDGVGISQGFITSHYDELWTLQWELVDPPSNCKIVGVKWIFKTKLKELGEIDKFKARLVAKGYTQEEGIDYREIFALVALLETIRTVVALAATRRWTIYQLDIKSAFLHGAINEDVYIEQPPGYVVQRHEHQ
ncbi:uncharacterized protein LOC114172930, partial [Vigna unguiculata]|uniref:uncharacterized protein LOC114172930 n=1 Tax=Vigna unguiculata TaxID=3917 RepID=UPI001015E9AF